MVSKNAFKVASAAIFHFVRKSEYSEVRHYLRFVFFLFAKFYPVLSDFSIILKQF